ncbi:MAG: outer membrane lipoprotein carrier protein LolA [bacterium]
MIHALLAVALLAVPAADSLWPRLREHYLGLRSLSGSFDETIHSELDGSTQEFSGSFWSVLPDRYRLEVTSPQRQLIVANDTVLWFHFPDEHRAVREVQPRAIPILAFIEPVLDTLTTARFEAGPDGTTIAFVESADEMPALQDLKLELARDRRRIDAFEFFDAWGSHYRFVLRSQQWNPDLAPALFRFDPPPGTTVE